MVWYGMVWYGMVWFGSKLQLQLQLTDAAVVYLKAKVIDLREGSRPPYLF